MKSHRTIVMLLSLCLCGQALAQTQDMDKELSDLAAKLASLTKENGKKKVTVLDFTDLQGASSELGKYIAEQLTVELVMVKQGFSVLDRANLKKIMAEHKLTATGLVDPENAKKLGQFAGVDALILGNIIPKTGRIGLTAKIITTDTAEIVGATKGEFRTDETVQQLLSRETTVAKDDGNSGGEKREASKLSKSFGDLGVELSLGIVNQREFLLTVILKNKNPRKSIWVALNTDLVNILKGKLTDSEGNEYVSSWHGISGIEYAAYQSGGFYRATEIKPNEEASGTVKFVTRDARAALPGTCRLQLEVLYGYEFRDGFGKATLHNILTSIKVD